MVMPILFASTTPNLLLVLDRGFIIQLITSPGIITQNLAPALTTMELVKVQWNIETCSNAFSAERGGATAAWGVHIFTLLFSWLQACRPDSGDIT